MLDELSMNFTFSKMDEKDAKYAFTYWLQNVLNMPLTLKTEGMDTFCTKFQVSYQNLQEYADKLNINLALLDDVIDQYISDLERK